MRALSSLTLELFPAGTHADHNTGHVAEHGGEQQQAEQQLAYDERVLSVAPGLGQVSDRGQRQRAPVVALQIPLDRVRLFGVRVRVHPVLAAEPVVLVDDVVQTAVPVEYHQQVVDEAAGPDQVRVVGVPFGAVHERPEPVDLHYSERPEDRVEPDGQVQEVERQQAQAVDVERSRVHVVVTQFGRVRLQHTVLQVPRAEVKQYVDHVQQVAQVVQTEPHDDRVACSTNDDTVVKSYCVPRRRKI